MFDKAPRSTDSTSDNADPASQNSRPTWFDVAPVGYWETPTLIDPRGIIDYTDEETDTVIQAIESVLETARAKNSERNPSDSQDL